VSILRPRCPRLRRNLEFLAPGSLRPPIPQPGTVPLGSTVSIALDPFGWLPASAPTPAQARTIPAACHHRVSRRIPPQPFTYRALRRIETHGLGARDRPANASIRKNRGTLWPTYRPDDGFRPAWVTEPFLVDTAVASAWPAFAGAKPGHGQHEHQKSLSPIRVGGGMPFGATPSIALPTETYPHARGVESEERSYSATEPRPLLNSPIRFPPRHPHPKPDPPA
jgi:hypothetical protein